MWAYSKHYFSHCQNRSPKNDVRHSLATSVSPKVSPADFCFSLPYHCHPFSLFCMATSAMALGAANILWRGGPRPWILPATAAAASSAQIVQHPAPCLLAHSRRHFRTSSQSLNMSGSKKFELSSKYNGLDKNVW